MSWITGQQQEYVPPPPDAWWKGRSRRMVMVVCCPQCGSADVKRLDSSSQSTIAYWGCPQCKVRWKELAKVGRVGVRAAE